MQALWGRVWAASSWCALPCLPCAALQGLHAQPCWAQAGIPPRYQGELCNLLFFLSLCIVRFSLTRLLAVVLFVWFRTLDAGAVTGSGSSPNLTE